MKEKILINSISIPLSQSKHQKNKHKMKGNTSPPPKEGLNLGSCWSLQWRVRPKAWSQSGL